MQPWSDRQPQIHLAWPKVCLRPGRELVQLENEGGVLSSARLDELFLTGKAGEFKESPFAPGGWVLQQRPELGLLLALNRT